MDVLFSFIGGVALSAFVAFLIARNVIKARVAKLESDLSNADRRAEEMKERVEETKNEMRARNEEAMEALQAKFNETIAKVTAQVKSETGEMLKARQEEFSQSSSRSLGQIVDPLKQNIQELRKAMEAENKEQAERPLVVYWYRGF